MQNTYAKAGVGEGGKLSFVRTIFLSWKKKIPFFLSTECQHKRKGSLTLKLAQTHSIKS